MRPARRLALWTVLLSALAGPAHAKPEMKAFGLEDLGGHVELGVRGFNNRGTRAGVFTNFENDSLKVDQILHLDLDGFVYHPNLLTVDAALDLHFMQQALDGEFFFLPGGYLNLSFLEKKPYGLSVFAEAVEKDVDLRYTSSYEVFSVGYGGVFRLDAGPLPFTLSFSHRDQWRNQDPLNRYDETWDQLRFRGRYELSENSEGDVRYFFNDGFRLQQRTRRHDALATNTTYFGGDGWKRLMSRVRYFQTSSDRDELAGSNDYSIASVLTDYDWRHTPRLRSNYQLEYQHEDLAGVQVSDRFNGEARLTHRLYSNLDTDVSIFGLYQDGTFGQSSEFGGSIGERYTKRLSDWGRLGIGVAPYAGLAQESPSQPVAIVKGESLRFVDLEPQELRGRDILKDTIRVYADERAGTITCPYPREGPNLDCVYRVNSDYRVDPPDPQPTEQTELVRLALGNIVAGQPLLVDYERLLTDQDRFQYGVRGDFEISYRDWMSVFADFNYKQEKILSGNFDRVPENPSQQTVGVRARRDWITAEVGFDSYQSTSRDVMGTYQILAFTSPAGRWWFASASVLHRMRSFTSPKQDSQTWRASGTLDIRLGRRGLFNLLMEYENENWSGANDADARDLQRIGLRPSLRWRYRQLELIMEAQIYVVERPTVELSQTFDRFFVRLRRYF